MTRVVVGIDVGGAKKGFHAVSLEDGRFAAKTRTCSVPEVADWCKAREAAVVAIDAPCRWRSPEGKPRSAETQMAAEGIACYYAPTESKARTHTFYGWMLPGMALFDELAADFPLFLNALPADTGARMIETFPHAVACALAGEVVSAKPKSKKAIRREILSRAGLDPESFSSIDEIDAALCAIAADHFVLGKFRSYGQADQGGCIVVPRPTSKLARSSSAALSRQSSTAPTAILERLLQLTSLERQQLVARLGDCDA